MTGYLLDTTVLIDWLRGDAATVAWLQAKAEQGSRLVLSPVTVAEVLAGEPPNLRARRREELSAYEFQPLTFETACLAGELRYDQARAGKPVALPDLLQVAAARILGLDVATSNPAHFPGVGVTNPREFMDRSSENLSDPS
ncbi:type II toxin-antitoxin system VapC family toxin [Limnochorda pilosa]|uniref:Ribonuclease VapC n=1 Tax=Limnochorda pilosa TaxID=1555112 RepID=A0A0K2SNV5_LIMPI|nr:PIN domain-containing protein [Limnochorda pilosa]BAS28514.1 twitching motility protein PilT [Limnochorda pilosa]